MPPAEAAAVALGLELAGQLERRAPALNASILLLEDDAETVRLIQSVLGPEGEGFQLRHGPRPRREPQLLMRRNPFSIVMLPIDNPDQEAFYQSLREHSTSSARFIGIVRIEDESQLDRLDGLGLDGVIHRPVTENDLRATVKQFDSCAGTGRGVVT